MHNVHCYKIVNQKLDLFPSAFFFLPFFIGAYKILCKTIVWVISSMNKIKGTNTGNTTIGNKLKVF